MPSSLCHFHDLIRTMPILKSCLSHSCVRLHTARLLQIPRSYSINTATSATVKSVDDAKENFKILPSETSLDGQKYPSDSWTNINPKILTYTNRKLHLQKFNPLCHIKRRIVDFMYKEFPSRTRSPLFSVFEDLNPVVTVEENFDSLLIPHDHPSRKKSDCYYINKSHLLRAHTSAHQVGLIRSGLNNFLVVGDVYRRDEIDRSHFPVFHQLEAVRLCTLHDVFKDENIARELDIFERGKCERSPMKQESHTVDAVMMMTAALQTTLINLVKHLFGKGKGFLGYPILNVFQVAHLPLFPFILLMFFFACLFQIQRKGSKLL